MKNILARRGNIGLVLFLSLCMASILPVFSQNQPGQTDANIFPAVTVRFTETRTFYSKILEREMVLYIKIPATYQINTQKNYPCYYGTDANLAFPMIADMANSFEIRLIAER